MKFATQALAQSSALASVLIAKGVVSKAELDATMKSSLPQTGTLLKLLDEQIKKQN
jgi:hypothetical protein